MDVLIDMTTFDTPSRHRGIGRYVRGLCDAMRSVRYLYPEYLSPTDNYMVMVRWLIREHARDLSRLLRPSHRRAQTG